jgi:cell volume regulation protein A
MLTAVITGYLFHLITGWSFMNSLLVASIISSTDAAAVFSIFKGHPIEARIKTMAELESVSNDPMAIVFTMFVINLMWGQQTAPLRQF